MYFEDDEDAEGKTCYRRVPVEHIILDESSRVGGKGGGGGGGGGGSGSGRGKARWVTLFAVRSRICPVLRFY